MDIVEKNKRLENSRARTEEQINLFRQTPRLLYKEIREKVNFVPSKIYLAGCGDSYYCGLATRMAFEEWTHIPTEALQALEFSRYGLQFAPEGAVAVTVSVSGKVSRTTECARYARSRGLHTIALTSNLEGPLANEAEIVIRLQYRNVGSGSGIGETLNYTATLLAEYCLAIRFGECSGKLSSNDVEQLLARLEGVADSIRKTMDICRPVLEKFAPSIDENAKIIIAGGGPNYGTAMYGAAKIVEASHKNPVGQELEEWCHIQYYTTGPGSYSFILAPYGRSIDRAREVLKTIRAVQGTAIAVCSQDDTETISYGNVAVPVFCTEDEILSPILYSIPLQLFVYYFTQSHEPIMLWEDDIIREKVNRQTIFSSNVPDWQRLTGRWNGH
jgi:glucosamine--fructose-6-phosphate aminotransferase (isomerizing)